MVVIGQSGLVQAKWLYSRKSSSNRGQIGCAQAKVVLFGQKWLYSRKRGCNRARVVVFGKSCRIWAKWL